MAIKLAELPNGVELTQVTTDTQEKSNIYCELPYCSVDSRLFVYEQKNPDTAPNTTQHKHKTQQKPPDPQGSNKHNTTQTQNSIKAAGPAG